MANPKRKANFSSEEISCLVEECSANLNTLYQQRISPDCFWGDLAEKVTSISGHRRSGEELKKKWKDLKSQAKKKGQARIRDMVATGGGPEPPKLSSFDEMIIASLPQVQVAGIEGPETDPFGPIEAQSEDAVLETDHENIVETVLRHPANVHVQLETPVLASKSASTERGECKKRKKMTETDMLTKQAAFFEAERSLIEDKKKKLRQQTKTLAAMEAYYLAAKEEIDLRKHHSSNED